MGAEAAAGTGGFIDHGFKLIETDGFFRKGAFVVAGTAQGLATPGYALEFIDNGQTHSGVCLTHSFQAAGGSVFDTFHAEVAGYLFSLN